MELLYIIRVLIAIPFIVYAVLRITGIKPKQARLIIFPLYLICFFNLVSFVFTPIFGSILAFIYLGVLFYIAIKVIVKNYGKIFMSRVIRKFAQIFSKSFPFVYAVCILIGYLKS